MSPPTPPAPRGMLTHLPAAHARTQPLVAARVKRIKCHFAVASTNALFCSASEWPLFFTVFSFFPPLMFTTETLLGQPGTVSGTQAALGGRSAGIRSHCAGLGSSGVSCPFALSWLQQRLPPPRSHSRPTARPTAALLGPTLAQLAVLKDKSHRWVEVNVSGGNLHTHGTVAHAQSQLFDLSPLPDRDVSPLAEIWLAGSANLSAS
ncbi:unnamed protein product [Pleuronectes platessa]|uniref:Uncharacterized protein n=1 Tax=Pleuronectes platessa TaxID=8262 RepID=A0A9N7UAP6_PLEPL|nr:unnamed protein product [Pleuronectes platessa]